MGVEVLGGIFEDFGGAIRSDALGSIYEELRVTTLDLVGCRRRLAVDADCERSGAQDGDDKAHGNEKEQRSGG